MNCSKETDRKEKFYFLRQQLLELLQVKEINIKNQAYYFFNDIINTKKLTKNRQKVL